ncbi:MAG: LuxR C-terminal-related transcriptional regulator [Psychroflexus sp.]
MDSKVDRILDLWKKPFLKVKSEHKPYAYPEQLKRTAGLFSPGLQYHFIIDMPTLKIEYISEGAKNILGIDPMEVDVELIIDRLIPEQKEILAKKESVVVDFFYNYLPAKEMMSYKSVYIYTIRDVDGNLRTILHQATPLTLTKGYKPKQVLVVHTDVSHLFVQHKDSLSFINLNNGKSFFNVTYNDGVFNANKSGNKQGDPFSDFTPKEKELIKKISEGLSTDVIAEQMNISIHTLRTHRKNILKKSSFKNIHEVVAQFLMAGVI